MFSFLLFFFSQWNNQYGHQSWDSFQVLGERKGGEYFSQSERIRNVVGMRGNTEGVFELCGYSQDGVFFTSHV